MVADTIYALSTSPGRSGIAVVRVSGPQALESYGLLTGKRAEQRHALLSLVTIINPVRKTVIDHALGVYFKAPLSFTGEDTVEYQVHGGPAVIAELMSVLSWQPGHRLAAPGEFTRRAFENGKMDLTEAEAIADLVHAETQMQKAQALAQMNGVLSKIYDAWRERLMKMLAYAEAEIEFPDEDLPKDILAELTPGITNLQKELAAHLDDNRRGERLRDGIQVAVIGAPNAGKSSLVNMLAKRDVAIVSDIAGTTRDVIEVHLDLGGYPVILADTAGLRPDQIGNQGQDSIESEGIRRALKRAQDADIRLLLFDATQDSYDEHTMALIDENSLIVLNKIDAGQFDEREHDAVQISVHTGDGIATLVDALQKKIESIVGSRETPSLTRARHREALEECRASVTRALQASLPELLAEDLRLASRALGRITGKVDVEDLLDVIFRDFCIGK